MAIELQQAACFLYAGVKCNTFPMRVWTASYGDEDASDPLVELSTQEDLDLAHTWPRWHVS